MELRSADHLPSEGRERWRQGWAGGEMSEPLDGAASELLAMLRSVASLGFVESMRPGDTGVGYTLETLLGIDANTSRSPDYKGIEIKASRGGVKRSSKRTTMFSQVPDWKLGGLGSPAAVLDEFGQIDGASGRKQFYCSVTSRPNPSGFYLSADQDADRIYNHVARPDGSHELVTQWVLSALLASLAAKHPQTFWVQADVRTGPDGNEQFRYISVRHTTGPELNAFAPLIADARVSVDYTLSTRASGAVRDHGYLWRINGSHHHVLFPDAVEYSLEGTSS